MMGDVTSRQSFGKEIKKSNTFSNTTNTDQQPKNTTLGQNSLFASGQFDKSIFGNKSAQSTSKVTLGNQQNDVPKPAKNQSNFLKT